jgi:transcriptional regulator with XRE-family HTH domain
MKKGQRLLRVVRAEQEPKVSQARLASRIAKILGRSFSGSRYWQIENGLGADPSKDEMSAIAVALGVKVSDIAWPTNALKRTA